MLDRRRQYSTPLSGLDSHVDAAHEQRSTYSTSDTASRHSYRSERSDKSYRSDSTVPTEYEYISPKHDWMPSEACHLEDEFPPLSRCRRRIEPAVEGEARASVDTYASSAPSICDQGESPPTLVIPQFHPDTYYDDTTPTTPSDFSRLFPSTRRLSIAHDDSTADGNMNLKITTQVRTPKGRAQNMTLFHLRMYDLESRKFSLRRYDRNSGREVCHSVRRYHKPSDHPRPGLQKTISNAFALLRTKSDTRMSTMISTPGRTAHGDLKHPYNEDSFESRPNSSGHDSRMLAHTPKDTTKLEFSNYAQVEVKRRGQKSNRRYELEYWGSTYQWKRIIVHEGGDEIVCYHLVHTGEGDVLAKIIPKPLSPVERRHESYKGGWIPPCAMWISDERVVHAQNDVSDVVVASGLVALVDDCIDRRMRETNPEKGISRFLRHGGQSTSKHSVNGSLSSASRPSSRDASWGSS
ncbi:hypothetical protein ANO11243_029550 [Dothideomycetidae sp. 11243]|nr:hypothetical protein ANO11243_029550 [fungal sp. No.11243]